MTSPIPFRPWRRLMLGTRSRILIWYIVLMAIFISISTLAIRQILFTRLENRIKKSLTQEVEEFRLLTQEVRTAKGQLRQADASTIFNEFLEQNIPEDDEFLITLLNHQIYKTSPRALPAILQNRSPLIQTWAQLRQPVTAQLRIANHHILYQAKPVVTQDGSQAVFVVAHFAKGEFEEIDQAIQVILQVSVMVLAIATGLAWWSAGRVLSPLRLLKATAKAITESDLTRRIPVQGSDDLAELATTFNAMLDRLQAAFTSQRDFINDAGHELRTPITIIRGHLELMGDDPDERRETLALVTDELDRMSRFVSDLLLLAKAEQPDFLALETVDLQVLTEELFSKARALADRPWELESKGQGQIVVDRQRLTQAMMNLAQNASQHTPPDGKIAMGSALFNGQLRLWVRDTGTGIAQPDQVRIFERFARGKRGQRRSDGAGLGLPIVQAIAQAHGGRVELYSQPGFGSTFTLVLPQAPPQE